MKLPSLCLIGCAYFGFVCSPAMADEPKAVRAHYVITVADDFVVEVYHNGQMVPHSKRELLSERFGATAERINIEVHSGDWLVFNVVNNQMRWGGAYYFAAAGCFERNSFGFVSDLQTGDWSACDTFGDVDRFITKKDYFHHRAAQEISRSWQDGNGLMQQFAGESWSGIPIWGATRNTWIKLHVR